MVFARNPKFTPVTVISPFAIVASEIIGALPVGKLEDFELELLEELLLLGELKADELESELLFLLEDAPVFEFELIELLDNFDEALEELLLLDELDREKLDTDELESELLVLLDDELLVEFELIDLLDEDLLEELLDEIEMAEELDKLVWVPVLAALLEEILDGFDEMLEELLLLDELDREKLDTDELESELLVLLDDELLVEFELIELLDKIGMAEELDKLV